MKKYYSLALFLVLALWANANTIIIAVDMNGVSEFDPASDVMKVGGDFNGWTPDNTVLTDDNGNGVYVGTFDLDLTFGGVILFKFVINAWETNEFHPNTPGVPGDCTIEDGGGNINRTFTLPATTEDFVMPVFKYNTCDISDLLSAVSDISTIKNIKVAPNPFELNTLITLDTPDNSAHDILITSMTGKVVRQLHNVRDKVINIERGNLAAGVYFITFKNDKGELGSQKLIIQ